MTALDELQKTITDVSTRVGPSVVGIGSRLRGSGVVIADGKVLTNAHNVRGDEVTINFAGGRSTRGKLAGIDVDGDLAVVNVDTSGAKAVEWADGSAVTPGTIVFAAAAAPDGATRVTLGTVSAVARAFRGPGGRRIAGSVEHTAPLAPGSSGGPVLNAKGQLLGINTNRIGEGFYLALPADTALRERVDALSRGQNVERPRLGVAVAPSHVAARLRASVGLPEREGLLVRGVEDGSLADKAGIQAGDLIIAAAGKPVTDADALFETLSTAKLPFEVKVVRGIEERTVSVGGGAVSGEA
jgi:S1-C subfamily serine protease